MKNLLTKIGALLSGKKAEKAYITREEIETMQKTIEKMSWLIDQYQSCLEAAEKAEDRDNAEMYQWAIANTKRRIREMEQKVSAC